MQPPELQLHTATSSTSLRRVNTFAFNELALNEGYSYFCVDMGKLEGQPFVTPATFLFEVVMRFWRDFLRQHGPYPDLPKGRTMLSDEVAVGRP